MPVKPGDILNDKLRIDALIGRGGMGQVFAATDLDERNQVAVKVVSRLFVDETLMLRLHREAVAAQRIRSDYVPRVFEVNDTGEGETYLVMERLMGEPLSARIRSQGSLPWPEVARLGEEILRGLIDAHSAGIIHRDLKPSNVFLALKTGKVRAMILDFGVCKMDGLDTERLTGTGESIGTVAYMAPEQIRGAAKVDERADIYAFGVVIFEMLSGRLPHEGPSQMAILASKLEKHSARLRDCVLSPIPEALDALVMQCLERDPRGRQATAQEVLRQWRILARAEGLISGPSVPPPGLDGGPVRPRQVTGPMQPVPHGVHGMGDNEPPTEISKPNVMTGEVEAILRGSNVATIRDAPYSTSDDEHLPPTGAPADFNSMFPPPSHPTEAPHTISPMASHDFGPKNPNTRIYLMGGGAAALIALCIFAFALSRPDPKRTHATTPPPPPVVTDTTAAVVEPAADPGEPAPAQTITAEDVELPAEAAEPGSVKAPVTVNQSRPRPVFRPRPPAPAPAPKASNQPRITEKPRF
ncbi:MAG: serine/threonine-protein kinase [Labilithrix sp.]